MHVNYLERKNKADKVQSAEVNQSQMICSDWWYDIMRYFLFYF